MAEDSPSHVRAPSAAAEPRAWRRGRPDESCAEALGSIARLRAEATRAVREAAQGDAGVCALVGRTGDGVSVLDFHVDGDAEMASALARSLEDHPAVDREVRDFASGWKTSFVPRSRVLRARRGAARLVATDPLGARLPVTDWAGLWVCRGRQLVAWVGVFRGPASRPFGASTLQGLARLVPHVQASALEAHATFIDAFGERGDVFLCSSGRLHCASPGGRRWLELPGNEAALSRLACAMRAQGLERLEAPVRGGTARLVRMTGAEAEGYLAELAPPSLVEHSAASDLTPAQVRVAALAVHGASAQQIALAVGSTEGTVRVHLRDIFRRLGVASRLELARLLGS